MWPYFPLRILSTKFSELDIRGKAQINEIQPSASMNPEEEKAKTIQGKSYEKPSQGTMRI